MEQPCEIWESSKKKAMLCGPHQNSRPAAVILTVIINETQRGVGPKTGIARVEMEQTVLLLLTGGRELCEFFVALSVFACVHQRVSRGRRWSR